MKPTGATKEATGHSPLPWKAYPANDNTDRWYVAQDGGDTPAYGTSITGWGCVSQSKADAELIVTAVNERERLREALRAALNSLSRTVRKSYPNYPEEQMQISETMTVASARTILNDATTSTSAGGGRSD